MNHTRNNFKNWLKTATHKELTQMLQEYRIKFMEYKHRIHKEGNLYPMVKGSGNAMENIRMVKWKINLMSNKLNLMVIKNG